MPQEILAEVYDASQPTVSRVATVYTSLIATLDSSVSTAQGLGPTAQLIIDGTLLERWPRPIILSCTPASTGPSG